MFDEYTKSSRTADKGKHRQYREGNAAEYKADNKGNRKPTRRQDQQFAKRVEKELQYA